MNAGQSARLDAILDHIIAERRRQDEKWGEQTHRDGTGKLADSFLADAARNWCNDRAMLGLVTWRDILDEEVKEAFAEKDGPALRAELVQVAAVCAAWIDDLDRHAVRVAEWRAARQAVQS